jgi:hypothetical protein
MCKNGTFIHNFHTCIVQQTRVKQEINDENILERNICNRVAMFISALFKPLIIRNFASKYIKIITLCLNILFASR